MRVCTYVDAAHENLYPLVLIRPAYELRCGIQKLWEKVHRAYPDAEMCFFMRESTAGARAQKLPAPVNDTAGLTSDDTLLTNGRTLWSGADVPVAGRKEVDLFTTHTDLLSAPPPRYSQTPP